MYDTNAVNAVTRAMRSEVSDHVTASEKKSLREVRADSGLFHMGDFGLYRDDGLGITKMGTRGAEIKIRQGLIKILH